MCGERGGRQCVRACVHACMHARADSLNLATRELSPVDPGQVPRHA